MIHDYYIYELTSKKIKNFEDWDREKENSEKNEEKKKKWREKNKDEKYKQWLEEMFIKPLSKKKKESQNKSKEDKNIHNFYPKPEDLQNFPKNSTLIKISFTLKKAYTSKDEGEFYIIDDRICENPIVRDKFSGLPMIRPSTWKGHLRFAAYRMEWDEQEKNKIIKRLFGSEPEEEDNPLKGRLYFFPTFFTEDSARDVITPLKRDTRTPATGPITLEVIKPETYGEFYLLYIPYPRNEDFKEEDIKEDLKFLAETLNLMFYIYGFSAKKTFGFGVIKRLEEKDVEVTPDNKKYYFSILYTKPNKTIKDGAQK